MNISDLGDFSLSNAPTNDTQHLVPGDLGAFFSFLDDEGLVPEQNALGGCYFRRLSADEDIRKLAAFVELDGYDEGFSVLNDNGSCDLPLEKTDYIAAFDAEDSTDPIGFIVLSRHLSADKDDGSDLGYFVDFQAIYVKKSERRKGVGSYLVTSAVWPIIEDLKHLHRRNGRRGKLDMFIVGEFNSEGGMYAGENLAAAIISTKEDYGYDFLEIFNDMGF